MDAQKQVKAAPFPERITLELTNACDLDCVFCPRQKASSTTGLMDVGLFKKAVDEIADNLPVALVPFFRGEALLHPRVIEMLDYASKKGVGPIQLATNAMTLGEEKARGIIESGVDFISFSLDTADPVEYEKARVGAKYDVVIRNIEKFLELREKLGARTPVVQVSSVSTHGDVKRKKDFIRRWEGRVDRVRIFHEHSKDGNYGSLENSAGLLDLDERLPCLKVFRELVFYWDGRAAICNHDWDRREEIGDLNESSIEKIWKSAALERIRRAHISGEVASAPCGKCDHWKMYYVPEGMIGELYEYPRSSQGTVPSLR